MSSISVYNDLTEDYEDAGSVVLRIESQALEQRRQRERGQEAQKTGWISGPTFFTRGLLLRRWGGFGGGGSDPGSGSGGGSGDGCGGGAGYGGGGGGDERQTLSTDVTTFGVNEADDEVVELNVGGVHYTTRKSILCTYKRSHLHDIMMSAPKDTKGRFFIDADGQAFRYILHFLRHGEFPWPLDPNEQKIIQDELRYYHLEGYVGNGPPPPSIPSAETEFRFLKTFGTVMAKLSEIDNSYLISDKLSRSCVYSLTKLRQVDQQYQIHHTIGSTLASGAGLALHLDTKYEIHQKLTNTIVSGITKVYELDQHYLIHERVATAVVTGYSVARALNERYQIQQKIGNSLKTSFRVVSDIDQQFKVHERVGRLIVGGLMFLFH